MIFFIHAPQLRHFGLIGKIIVIQLLMISGVSLF